MHIVNIQDTAITLSGHELLEVVHRYLEEAAMTDGLGGAEWARRIDEAGGPEEYRDSAFHTLTRAVLATLEEHPETCPHRLRETWESRYGPDGYDTPSGERQPFPQDLARMILQDREDAEA